MDSVDVAIQATIDSINALSFPFSLAMLGLTASCITIKFNARGLDSNRGFLESTLRFGVFKVVFPGGLTSSYLTL